MEVKERTNDYLIGWVVGFVDGEGCFHVSFTKRKRLKLNIEARCSFSVSQNRRSLESLEILQTFFGCGGIRYDSRSQCYKYEVRDRKDLGRVVSFFSKYRLKTNKVKDFIVFREAYKLILRNHHLSESGLRKVIDLGYNMNSSGTRRYTKEELLRLLQVKGIV